MRDEEERRGWELEKATMWVRLGYPLGKREQSGILKVHFDFESWDGLQDL